MSPFTSYPTRFAVDFHDNGQASTETPFGECGTDVVGFITSGGIGFSLAPVIFDAMDKHTALHQSL